MGEGVIIRGEGYSLTQRGPMYLLNVEMDVGGDAGANCIGMDADKADMMGRMLIEQVTGDRTARARAVALHADMTAMFVDG